MKKTIFIYSSLALLLIISTSCGKRVVLGKGSMTSQERNVGAFTMIDISAPITADIHVKPGAPPSVQFSGYENLMNEIKTTVAGNTLKIYRDNYINFDTDKDILADITVASLSDLRIHGSADAKLYGTVTGTDFQLKISGAGDVWIEKIEVKSLTASISGAGDVKVGGGTADKLDYSISGAGDMKSFGVVANNVTAKVSGAGEIEVNAVKTLDATVSGAGSIKYKGHPVLKSKTSGIGEIVAAE